MLLRELGEFGFIDRIREKLAADGAGVIRGIGDDCAVIRGSDGRAVVVTTDALVEDVHFLVDRITPGELGWKALAVNLSDVAAMGATPEYAVVTLVAPGDTAVEWLIAFYDGLRALADRHGVAILGGDTSSSPAGLMISITAIGSAPEAEIRYRSGARPGDAILVAGVIGESGAGLDCLLEPLDVPADVRETLVRRHLVPEPLVAEGRWLARSGKVGAMLDVSDGIASDIRHICRASNAGAIVDEQALPVSPALAKFLAKTGRPAIRYLAGAGEDYALLFTAPADRADDLVNAFRTAFSTPIARVGTMTTELSILLRRADGTLALLSGGHDHFRA